MQCFRWVDPGGVSRWEEDSGLDDGVLLGCLRASVSKCLLASTGSDENRWTDTFMLLHALSFSGGA